MTLIKCGACNAEVPENSVFCSSCGTRVSKVKSYCSSCDMEMPAGAAFCSSCGKSLSKENKALTIDINTHLESVKNIFSSAVNKVTSTVEDVSDYSKEFIKSQKEQDKQSIDNMSFSISETDKVNQPLENFKAALTSTIDAKFAEVMKGKSDSDNFLTFTDGQILTASVRNVFVSALDAAPPQVEVACELSEAILAPTSAERNNLVKSAVGIGGGAAGIGMILTAVGGALGWGTGVVASMSAFFVGTSLAGPAGWAIAGLSLTGMAAYFATTSNKHTDTERFLNVLKQASCKAVDTIWSGYEEPLTKVLGREQ